MRVDFKQSFSKDLKKIKDKSLLDKIKNVILEIEQANNIYQIKNVKKLKIEGDYFRIKIKDLRIGILIKENIVIFIRALPRKDIYKFFP